TRLYPNEKEAAKDAYYQMSMQVQPQYHHPGKRRVPPSIGPPPGMMSTDGPLMQQPASEASFQDDYEGEEEVIFETPEQMLARRKNQLVLFYQYWDPDRPNIKEHVETLFERHDFEHVARAVRTKFGLVPPG